MTAQVNPNPAPQIGQGQNELNEKVALLELHLLGNVNGKRAPWLEFKGEPGSKKYARRVAAWLSEAFYPERYKACGTAKWWYADRAPSVRKGTEKHPAPPIIRNPESLGANK